MARLSYLGLILLILSFSACVDKDLIRYNALRYVERPSEETASIDNDWINQNQDSFNKDIEIIIDEHEYIKDLRDRGKIVRLTIDSIEYKGSEKEILTDSLRDFRKLANINKGYYGQMAGPSYRENEMSIDYIFFEFFIPTSEVGTFIVKAKKLFPDCRVCFEKCYLNDRPPAIDTPKVTSAPETEGSHDTDNSQTNDED